MSTDYNYDEQGQFFPFFILTVAGIFTLPLTYSALRPSKELENTAPRIQSDFVLQDESLINRQRRRQKRRQRKLKRGVTAAVGWAVMALMVYLIMVTARSTPKIWDPYSILGVPMSSSEKQIKKHYKLLSLSEHPDKRRPDPAKNETLQTINDHWVEVTKAFKALTDEEIRNNFLQYGHPDGKQSFSIGIALPQFIVAEGSGRYVLLLYAGLLGILLPYFVGSWWYGTQRMTRDGVLRHTAGKLFTEYKEDIEESGVVGALSGGAEYDEVLKNKKGEESSSKIESRVLADNGKITMSKSDRQLLLDMDDEGRRKALGLLWVYLNRVDLDDPTLDEQKYAAAIVAFTLNDSFTSITLAYGNLKPLLASYHTSQSLIQAVPPGASPLLQLPHFTTSVISALAAAAPDSITSLQSFMALPDARRRDLLLSNKSASSPLLTRPQYATAMRVASQIPHPIIERAFFKVIGERHVTPGSLIQFVVKLRIIPPGTPAASIPPVNPADLEDPDPKEGDVDALNGRKKGNTSDPNSEDRIQPPLAHAPFFARDHSPRWRVFLGESRSGKIAVPPFTFTTFDRPLFRSASGGPEEKSKGDDSAATGIEPTCAVQTFKCQFQAPPAAGDYAFTMHLVCDSYIGLDVARDILMQVEDVSMAEEVESEGEISEPDEDSLAGQMSALKGGATSSGGKKKATKKVLKQEVSDDESDTEGEAEDSSSDEDTDTDTDTDTDDE